MTDQYHQSNINNPKKARTISVSTQAASDDSIIVANSAAGILTVTLPSATASPGSMLTIKAPVANVNNVTVSALAGQTIDGAASFIMDSAQQALVVQSNGNDWEIALPGTVAQEDVLSILSIVAVDAAAEILATTSGIQLEGSLAGAKAIATTSSYAGQKVNIFLLTFVGGSYTLTLNAGTLTFNSPGAGAVIQRNSDNTAWVVVGLSGATIV